MKCLFENQIRDKNFQDWSNLSNLNYYEKGGYSLYNLIDCILSAYNKFNYCDQDEGAILSDI